MDKDTKPLYNKPYHIVIIEDKIMDLQNFYPAKKLTNGVVQHTLKSGATISAIRKRIFHQSVVSVAHIKSGGLQ
jgi:hypothetical protein